MADERCPPSVTPPAIAAAALIALISSTLLLRFYHPFEDDMAMSCLVIVFVTTAVIFIPELFWYKVYLRASTGLEIERHTPSVPRTIIKLLGLVTSVGLIGFLYWAFPEYHASFYDPYYRFLSVVLPFFALAAIPYFYWVDSHMIEPRDGYWNMGRLVMMNWRDVDVHVLRQHLLGWLIKGFFLPLMVVAFCDNLKTLLDRTLVIGSGFKSVYDYGFHYIFFVDTVFAAIGYMMAFRLTDSHIRSAEPTTLGWLVALLCYQPFWSMIGGNYLAYGTDYNWDTWLHSSPTLYAAWGATILALLAIYTWSTVMFAARFSNLTHRGIVTSGPYRWLKHPAYVTKNLSFWMIGIPFLTEGPWDEKLRRCLLLVALNAIYWLRAKTEERHLSQDTEYVAYSRYMVERGLLGRLSKFFAALRQG